MQCIHVHISNIMVIIQVINAFDPHPTAATKQLLRQLATSASLQFEEHHNSQPAGPTKEPAG